MALVAQSTTQTSTQTDNIALLSSRKNLQMEEIYQQTFSAKINYFEQGVPERTHLEDFICGVYKKYYNADIDQFYPNLLAIESRADNKRTISILIFAEEQRVGILVFGKHTVFEKAMKICYLIVVVFVFLVLPVFGFDDLSFIIITLDDKWQHKIMVAVDRI